ncbi:MAG TPA: dihydrolipoyl dehydrogenase [Bacillota bacterium]|nr:dihydrolipoyl dehydrogenase [Bacillota bacterium]HOG52602.1 dihydrolipoyl dehydrogenase [Bacillota bacterium]
MFDCLVIGGGPGGYTCAIRAAQLGLKVALAEARSLGGVCLNWGCIPTKALAHTADTLMAAKKGADFGVNCENVSFDMAKAMAKKDRITARHRAGVGFLMKKNGITVLNGRARIESAGKVKVTSADGTENVYETKNIVIATGSAPVTPGMFGYDGELVLTSDEMLTLKEVPGELLVVGAGVIGCEFASIYSAFGSKVTLVDVMPRILPMVDEEASALIAASFKKRGMEVITGVGVRSIEKTGSRVAAVLEDGRRVEADRMLLSIGRRPASEGTGAKEAGVGIGRAGEITVDNRMRTNVPGIWAIGDVNNRMQLAHVASAQGIVCASNMAGQNRTMDYFAVPNCVFTSPEVSQVGVSEAGAKESGIGYKVGRFPYSALGKASTMGEAEGFVKLVADADGRVIGGTVVGAHASDLIAEVALAVANQLGLKDVAHTVHAHPTLPEGIMEAAEEAFGLAINI